MKKTLIGLLLIVLVGFLFFNVGSLFSQEDEEGIEWLSSYDEALKIADDENKYIFVLITAPSWCKPCQFLEGQIFTDRRVQALLNNSYVPVKILDTNEEELEKFDVLGYPTLLVYDQDGELITPIRDKFVEGEYTPSDLVNALRKILMNITTGIDNSNSQGGGGCAGGACDPPLGD
jgi:thiol:disulfide interchange protein